MPIRRTPRRGWRPLLLLAAVALLTLPVDLRAGLPLDHPHALLSLLADAADGTIDHDHAVADEGLFGRDHADHGAVGATVADLFDPGFANVPVAATRAATSATTPPAHPGSPDLPSLSPAGPGVGGGAVVWLAAAVLPVPTATGRRLLPMPLPVLLGRAELPTSPPPRAA